MIAIRDADPVSLQCWVIVSDGAPKPKPELWRFTGGSNALFEMRPLRPSQSCRDEITNVKITAQIFK